MSTFVSAAEMVTWDIEFRSRPTVPWKPCVTVLLSEDRARSRLAAERARWGHTGQFRLVRVISKREVVE